MLKESYVGAILVTVLMTGVNGNYNSSDVKGIQKLSPAITDFSLDLFKMLYETETGENLILSPTNIFRVMLLTYFGSEGLTRLLMEMAMKLDMNYTEAVNQYKIWRNQKVDGVREGDRIYVDSKIQLKPNITALLGEDISEINFSDSSSVGIINDWVANATGGEIKDFLDEIRSDTLLMLISVIYMKEVWKKPFEKRDTTNEFFYYHDGKVDMVPMMHKTIFLDYHNSETLRSEILRIPYEGDRLSFIIFLPHLMGPENFQVLINSLNYTILRQELSQLWTAKVYLAMPKFRVEKEIDMKPLFVRLGLSNLFSPRTADFSGFTDHELYVNEVLQKVVIKVNEEGTTASAASFVRGFGRSLNVFPNVEYTVDRPFVYMVYDHVANVPLFIGAMMKPEYPVIQVVTHKFGHAITDFSLHLFRALHKNATTENLIMSPSNVFRVMLLAYFGSGGLTSVVMKTVMGINMNFNETIDQYNIWKSEKLEGVKEADRIFFDTHLQLTDKIRSLLGEDISQIDFSDDKSVKKINNWVEENTGGEIKGFIDELDPKTKMLLTSVICMNKPWDSEFYSGYTEAMNFTLSNGTTREVKMMNKYQEYFKYHHSDTLRSRILTIPYLHERLSFIVFLPDQETSTTVRDVIECMNYTNIKKELQFRQKRVFNFYLPKFEVHQDLDFRPLMDKVGLSEIFDAEIANFDNFTSDPKLHVSKVFQKVVMKVDEKGSGASATGGFYFSGYGGSRIDDYILDRPFVYMVYDELAGVPLFLGTMMDPTSN